MHIDPQTDLPQTETTTGSTIDWSKFKQAQNQQEEAAKYAQSQTNQICPNCGYCPHCGRGGHQTYPYYPTYPWITYTSGGAADPSQFYK